MFFDGNSIGNYFSMLSEQDVFDKYGLPKDYNDNIKLYSTEDGFIKGNMFKELYKPYKNYNPRKFNAKTEREALLYKIMAYEFAFDDISLYLDLYPDDKEMLEMFKKNVEEYKKIKKEYASKFGPITIDQSKYNEYKWIENPWPWDKMGGGMYV